MGVDPGMGESRSRGLVGLLALLALALTVAVVPASPASAAAHRHRTALDPTFGRHGRVLAVPPQETEPSVFAAAAREPNGEVLLDLQREALGGTARELELRRPNGELDPSFGEGGRRAVHPGEGLLALGDGSIVIGVEKCDGQTGSVMKLGPEGAPVSSFGRNGCSAYTGFGTRHLAVDPAGDILIGGTTEYCDPCGKDVPPRSQSIVARLLPGGSLDRSFGGRGLVASTSDLHLEAPEFGGYDQLEGLAPTADGGVVISSATSLDATVLRLDPSGALDPGFGTGGLVSIPGHDAGPVVVQPDGSIDLVSTASEDALFVTKLGPRGNVETSFGEGGTARIPRPSGLSPYELVAAAAPAGGLIVGSREPFPRPCAQPCYVAPFLARLTATGQLDPTYGNGGTATIGTTSASSTSPRGLDALLVGPDGSTLVAGNNQEEGGEGGALLTAQTAAGAPDPALGGTGTLSEHFEKPTQLGPTGLALGPHGRLAVMNLRADAPGFIFGQLLTFGRDGKQLPYADGAPAVKTGFHGALVRVAGGFLVWNEEEARNDRVIHAIGFDGAPLTGFGTDGVVALPPKFVPYAIESAPGGGAVMVGASRRRAMAIYRIGPDGRPLPGFGHDGLAFAFRGNYTVGYDALVEADGDTIVSGWAGTEAVAARLLPDGKLDRSFGRRGVAGGLLGPESIGEHIAPWPGGGTVIAGTREDKKHDKMVLLTRLDRRGNPAGGFGHRGAVRVGTEYRPLAVVVTGRRIVLVTVPRSEDNADRHGVELRAFLSNGAVDRRFGDGGVEIYGSAGRKQPYFTPLTAIAQPGGRVVVAGADNYGDRHSKAELVRFRVP